MTDHMHTYPAGATTCTVCGLTLTDLAKQIQTCDHCRYTIVTAPTATGWTHDNEDPIWQGVRCPNRLTGATPQANHKEKPWNAATTA